MRGKWKKEEEEGELGIGEEGEEDEQEKGGIEEEGENRRRRYTKHIYFILYTFSYSMTTSSNTNLSGINLSGSG